MEKGSYEPRRKRPWGLSDRGYTGSTSRIWLTTPTPQMSLFTAPLRLNPNRHPVMFAPVGMLEAGNGDPFFFRDVYKLIVLNINSYMPLPEPGFKKDEIPGRQPSTGDPATGSNLRGDIAGQFNIKEGTVGLVDETRAVNALFGKTAVAVAHMTPIIVVSIELYGGMIPVLICRLTSISRVER